MLISQILRAAVNVISSRENFCKSPDAVDPDGHSVSAKDTRAHRRNVRGAIFFAAETAEDAGRVFRFLVPESSGVKPVVLVYNFFLERTHEEALSVLHAEINRAERMGL